MGKKAKILVCDDEQGVREAFKFILQGRYALSFAGDGLKALEQIKKCPPDLVLLDIKMPGMDGLKVLKEVKRIKPQIKVVVVTGYSTIATAYRAIRYGAADYIPKPFDKRHILKAIETVLKEKA